VYALIYPPSPEKKMPKLTRVGNKNIREKIVDQAISKVTEVMSLGDHNDRNMLFEHFMWWRFVFAKNIDLSDVYEDGKSALDEDRKIKDEILSKYRIWRESFNIIETALQIKEESKKEVSL